MPMDSYSFKSVPFGGFDKQDVVHYIEQASEKAAAVQRELQEENHSLRTKNASLEDQIEELQRQLEKLTDERDRLQSDLRAESAHRKKLEPLRPLESETARLRDEVEKLRPDALAYAQFRERLGAIECEARKRADDLEAAAQKRIRQTVDTFRTQYQALMSTFETGSSHMTAELRKIEVSLTQLPHAMDKTSAALDALTDQFGPPPGNKGR